MPLYDYQCQVCLSEHEQQHRMAEQPAPCPTCGSRDIIKVFRSIPKAQIPDRGWESENNGRGRYIGQLAARADKTDPGAFCRSRTEAIEKAKRQGWKTIIKC